MFTLPEIKGQFLIVPNQNGQGLFKYPLSVHLSISLSVYPSLHHIISDHYLYNHSSYCFHIGTVNSP